MNSIVLALTLFFAMAPLASHAESIYVRPQTASVEISTTYGYVFRTAAAIGLGETQDKGSRSVRVSQISGFTEVSAELPDGFYKIVVGQHEDLEISSALFRVENGRMISIVQTLRGGDYGAYKID